MRADEALPDHLNEVSIDGLTIRKGTVAAFLASAKTFVDPAASDDARRAAERDIVASVPALHALGLLDVMAVRDPRVRALVERGDDARAPR